MNNKLIMMLFFLSVTLKIGCSEEQFPLKKSKMKRREESRHIERIKEMALKREYTYTELSSLVKKGKVTDADLSLLSQEERNEKLFVSMHSNNLEMVESLLKAKANPEFKPEGADQSLLYLVTSNWYGRKDYHSRSECREDTYIEYLQHYPRILELFLEAGADPNADHNRLGQMAPIHAVAEYFYESFSFIGIHNEKIYLIFLQISYELLEILLKGGANPHLTDELGNCALHLICKDGMLKHNLTNKYYTPYADKQIKHAALLLEHKADPNQKNVENMTPVMVAASSRNYLLLELLLKRGGAATEVDMNGITPLYRAVDNGLYGNAIHLLQYGADLSRCTPDGITVINIASSPRLKGYLMEIKSNGLENKPLLLCCRYPNPSRVLALLNLNADPNQTDKNGKTPLMFVAETSSFKNNEEDCLSIVKSLFAAGADPLREAADGITAVGLGSFTVDQEIRKHILKQTKNKVHLILKETFPVNTGRENIAELILVLAGTWEPS
ncbi:MAG: ankyrin repeat domain-containing protein [Candidatus Babeliales bacterium]